MSIFILYFSKQPNQNRTQDNIVSLKIYLIGGPLEICMCKTLYGYEIMKKTFFGCSLDGAFKVVNRSIQTCELCIAGFEGYYWKSKYNYHSDWDSVTNIKKNQQLTREIKETLGVKQGGFPTGFLDWPSQLWMHQMMFSFLLNIRF